MRLGVQHVDEAAGDDRRVAVRRELPSEPLPADTLHTCVSGPSACRLPTILCGGTAGLRSIPCSDLGGGNSILALASCGIGSKLLIGDDDGDALALDLRLPAGEIEAGSCDAAAAAGECTARRAGQATEQRYATSWCRRPLGRCAGAGQARVQAQAQRRSGRESGAGGHGGRIGFQIGWQSRGALAQARRRCRVLRESLA